MSQHVVESGGLVVLQALLPEPPAPPPTAEELAAFMSSSGGIADTVDGLKLPPKLAASKVCEGCLLSGKHMHLSRMRKPKPPSAMHA